MKTSLVCLSKKTTLLFTICFVGVLIVPQYIHHHFSIDGGYSEWTMWGECSATCGNSVKGRRRNCSNPIPRGGGKPCSVLGARVEVIQCAFVHCPQDGEWGSWGSWSPCEPNCKDGRRNRKKLCDNPPPMYGGFFCLGKDIKEEGKCDHLAPCPINGGLSNWNAWGPCSLTCGSGKKERKRLCNNPEPKYGGKQCTQPLLESTDCKQIECPIDGGVSEWGMWTGCSLTCGRGRKERERLCNNPIPQYNGKNCSETLSESNDCKLIDCPVTTKAPKTIRSTRVVTTKVGTTAAVKSTSKPPINATLTNATHAMKEPKNTENPKGS